MEKVNSYFFGGLLWGQSVAFWNSRLLLQPCRCLCRRLYSCLCGVCTGIYNEDNPLYCANASIGLFFFAFRQGKGFFP